MEFVINIFEYLNKKGWVVLTDAEEQVTLLGHGKCNSNFLISAQELYGEAKYLFRLNHTSSLGVPDQVEYEFDVLQALRRSGVTPRPFYCDSCPESKLGKGVLFMEYLEGRQLRYSEDLAVAAEVMGKVHSIPVDGRFVAQKNRLSNFISRKNELMDCAKMYGHEGESTLRLNEWFRELADIANSIEDVLAEDSPVIINGSVSCSDFIVHGDDEDETKKGSLVDWERGAVSSRYFDIGQFLVQASLSGEHGHRLHEVDKCHFAEVYIEAVGLDVSTDELVQRSSLVEHAITLQNKIMNYSVSGKNKIVLQR